MNTERPDKDDTGAPAFESARDTGGSSAPGTGADRPETDTATPAPPPRTSTPETTETKTPETNTGHTGTNPDRAPKTESGPPGAGAEPPGRAEPPTGPPRAGSQAPGKATAGTAADGSEEQDPRSGSVPAPGARDGQSTPTAGNGAPPAGNAQAGSSASLTPKPADVGTEADTGMDATPGTGADADAEFGAPQADVPETRDREAGPVPADAHGPSASEDTAGTVPGTPRTGDATSSAPDSVAAAGGGGEVGGADDRAPENRTQQAHRDASAEPETEAPATGGTGTDGPEGDGDPDRAAVSKSVKDVSRAQNGAAVAGEPESAVPATGISGPAAAEEAAADERPAPGERETGTAKTGSSSVEAAPADGPVPDSTGERPDVVPVGGGGPGAGRRRSPGLVAAVAAAVLLIGGGGAYLAASASGGSGSGGTTPGANGDGTPPPLTLDAYAEGGPHGVAPGELHPYGAAYRAVGALPEGPGTAPVYRVEGQITEAQVTGLAEALGMDGKPVAEDDAWRIGGKDGSGPTLRVDRAAPGTWTFSRYTPGPDACTGKGEKCQDPSADETPTVSEEAAKKAVVPVLKALGQDDSRLDADQVIGVRRVVNAEPETGGLPTYGWTTGVVVGAGGEVVGGSGRLSKPVKADTYPVVSAEKALESLNTAPGTGRSTGVGGCATPVPLEENDDQQQEQREPCFTASTPPGEDAVVVERAVFGLAAHAVDGQQALVPSWLFEVRPTDTQDAGTVTYPAIEPEYLAPRARSGESSTEPGDGDRPISPSAAAREVAVEGYASQDDGLAVVFTGGTCADYEVTAGESDGRVSVTVTETPWPGKVCVLIAKQYQQTVPLDAPLGDRQVVDADGEPVPPREDGARLPAPPSQR